MDAPSRGSCTQKIPRTLANGELTMYLFWRAVRKCTGQKNPQRATGRGLGLPHCGETASFMLRELHRLSQEVMMQHGSSREKRKCLLESS